MNAKDRVRKHRDKLRAKNCSRMDLWIDSGLFDDLRTLATYRGLPLRDIAQEAFSDVVGRYSGVLAIIKRQRGGPPVTGRAAEGTLPARPGNRRSPRVSAEIRELARQRFSHLGKNDFDRADMTESLLKYIGGDSGHNLENEISAPA